VGNEADLLLTWMTTGLPDHVGRLEEEGWRDGQAQRLRGLEVDDELQDRGLLDGEVSRPNLVIIPFPPVGNEADLTR
jgi:hypothetical protein